MNRLARHKAGANGIVQGAALYCTPPYIPLNAP
jgi:hypothetical protein